MIQAARELLRKVHPSSLTRKAVAEAAAVDPALVRYYFSDLQHLLREVLKVLVSDYRERFSRLDIDPEQPELAVEKRVRLLVTFLAQEPSFHDLFIDLIVKGTDEWARETRDSFTDQFFGSLNVLIESGRAKGRFRSEFDPRFAYLAIIGAAQFLSTSGPIFHRLFGMDRAPRQLADDYGRFMSEMILRGIAK